MNGYLRGHDTSKVAEDAVFVVMATGQESKGHAAIDHLLDYFYNQAFTAILRQSSQLPELATVEGNLHGIAESLASHANTNTVR